MAAVIIEIQKVRREYSVGDTKIYALRDVSFQIKQG